MTVFPKPAGSVSALGGVGNKQKQTDQNPEIGANRKPPD